jgi:NitT/TauT family transport system ATP-binding protein
MATEPARKGAKIDIAGLRKVFETPRGSVEAIQTIDVSIKPGEFFCIVGPSGCGKSTLLRILAGLEKQSAGTIAVGSAGWKVENAMVFQDSGLFPWMSV